MKWHKRIELYYRVYSRLHEESLHTFDLLEESLEECTVPFCSLTKSDLRLEYWPISPEKLEKCLAKGFFVMDKGNMSFLAVREKVYTLSKLTMETSVAMETILSKCGNVFAAIKVIDEAFTEIMAV